MNYPEHEKQKVVLPDAETIGTFLDWLSEKEMVICSLDRWDEYVPIRQDFIKLLADYFGIDLREIEKEKQAMLDEQRKLNR